MVPVTGLEPVRHRWRWILSPLRLPFHHTGRCVTTGYILRSAARGAGVRLRCVFRCGQLADTVYNTFSKIARGKSAQSLKFPPFGGRFFGFAPEAALPL